MRILVGTYHKCATMWFRGVFHQFAQHYRLNFYMNGCQIAFGNNRKYTIFFDDHSLFNDIDLDSPDCVILHTVRDPRDMLLSAVYYHLRAPVTREKWLHTPRPGLDGKSYQQHLRSLSSFEEKLIFEMNNSHRANANLMLKWDYDLHNSSEVRYERLMEDNTGVYFSRKIEKLELDEEMNKFLRQSFVKSHISNQKVNKNENVPELHVREKKTDWRMEFSGSFAEKYNDRYGELIRKLGYESNDSWIDVQRG